MKKIIAGLFAIAAFTFSASAQNPNNPDGQKKWDRQGQGYHRGHDGKGMGGMEKLNLTDAQKQQMKSINEDFKTRMQALNKNDNMMVKDFKAQRESLMQERKNKISAILTPEQKTQFEQLKNDRGFRGDRPGGGNRMRGNPAELKSQLGLTDDQVAKIKAGSESFKQRGKAIHENQSLSADQKKEQFETLRKEREANFKSYLTAEQITKLDQMKKNKGDGWKEKRKSSDGKEKVKVKTS